MATYTLQTARPGANPTNSVFQDQTAAMVEALKAHGSGEFEMVRLLERSTSAQNVLFDSARFDGPKKKAAAGGAPAGGAKPAPGQKLKPVKAGKDMSRLYSFGLSFVLVLAVLTFLAARFVH